MRLFTLIAVLVAGLSVPGCVVPPVWDISDAINKVDQIKEGTTTREQVLEFLGEPDYGKEESAFRYTGKWSDGYIMFGGYGTKSASLSLIDEKGWWIDISFDESGVVQILSTNSAGPPSF